MLDKCIPDILISDIGIPEIDGCMLVRTLRSRSAAQGGKIPAIALTVYAGDNNYCQAIDAGFHSHLPKPIDFERLVTLIQELVKEL